MHTPRQPPRRLPPGRPVPPRHSGAASSSSTCPEVSDPHSSLKSHSGRAASKPGCSRAGERAGAQQSWQHPRERRWEQGGCQQHPRVPAAPAGWVLWARSHIPGSHTSPNGAVLGGAGCSAVLELNSQLAVSLKIAAIFWIPAYVISF